MSESPRTVTTQKSSSVNEEDQIPAPSKEIPTDQSVDKKAAEKNDSEKRISQGVADTSLPPSEGIHMLQPFSGEVQTVDDFVDFASNLKAHNALLHNCNVLNSSVNSVKNDLSRIIAAIKATDDEREKQISTLQHEMQKYSWFSKKLDQIDLDFSGLQASLEEKMRKNKEDADKSLRQMDEMTTPKFKALEKTMENFMQKQSDVVTNTLPKLQSELGSEIQKLVTDLFRLQETTSERFETLQKTLATEQEAREFDAKSRMEGIACELIGLKEKVIQVEVQAGSTDKTLQKTSSELKTEDAALVDRIKQQGEKLEALIAKEVTVAKDVVHADLSARIKDVENACKQADFERLRTQELLQQTIVDKVKDLSAASEASFRDAEASRIKIKEDLSSFKTQLNTKVSNLAQDSGSRLQRLEETAAVLRKDVTSLDDRLASSIATLQLSLQNHESTLEQTTKQLKSTFDEALSLDGKEISILKAGLSQTVGDHKEFSDSVKKELDEVRSRQSATQAAINGQTQATNTIFERMDPMSEAIRDVVRDLGACNTTLERFDSAVHQMHVHMEDHSKKLTSVSDTHRRICELEWYIQKTMTIGGATTTGNCFSCGRSNPPFQVAAKQPTPPFSGGGSSVKQPHTSRPSSARSRGKGETMDSSGVQMSPSGTGMFAARFQRSTVAT